MSRLEKRLGKSLENEEEKIEEDSLPEFETAPIQEKPEQSEPVETNPHKLYKSIIQNPTPRGTYQLTLRGRPIDFRDLENYLIFKISPKNITTIMRYNESKTIAEVGGLYKRRKVQARNLGGIIVILLIMVAVGIFLATGGMNRLLSMFHLGG